MRPPCPAKTLARTLIHLPEAERIDGFANAVIENDGLYHADRGQQPGTTLIAVSLHGISTTGWQEIEAINSWINIASGEDLPKAEEMLQTASTLMDRGKMGRAKLFRQLGGTWRRPEPDACYWDELEWHGTLMGMTGYGPTCDTAIIDWCTRVKFAFRSSPRPETCPDDTLPGATPLPAL